MQGSGFGNLAYAAQKLTHLFIYAFKLLFRPGHHFMIHLSGRPGRAGLWRACPPPGHHFSTAGKFITITFNLMPQITLSPSRALQGDLNGLLVSPNTLPRCFNRRLTDVT